MIKVIKGGLDSSNPSRYKFINAEVTDTRLMGVVAMHTAYRDSLNDDEAFHQFWYFDYEELGLEHMRLLRSDDTAVIAKAVKDNFAGLGADIVELSEKEASYLAHRMVLDTKEKKQELPPELEETKFIFENASSLDDRELDLLNVKLCVPIKSDYGIVNYFLMRCFGNDREGARLLIERGYNIDELDITPEKHATFLRNKIAADRTISAGRTSYRCESLVEIEEESRHYLIVSEVEVSRRKVVRTEKISGMPVSSYEASLLLNREEYVTVYKLNEEKLSMHFAEDFYEFTSGMTRSEHDAGIMFMDFKPDNSHAENKLFMLSDDIRALYYLTETGQIVLTAYSIDAIIQAEARLYMSFGEQKHIEATNRYTFPASIVFDFAESGMTDFNAYLKTLE